MQACISRVNDVVKKMRGLGDTMPEQLTVGKILRSLGPRYNFVVAAIAEAKDLTKLTMDKLSGSLQAHEFLMFSQDDNSEARSFVVKPEASSVKQEEKAPVKEVVSLFRGRGRGMFRGRGRNRSRGMSNGQRQAPRESRSYKNHIQSHNCKRFGYVKATVDSKIRVPM